MSDFIENLKARAKETMQLTSSFYYESICEIIKCSPEKAKLIAADLRLYKNSYSTLESSISQLYRDKLIQLPTLNLEDIIHMHENGIVNRADITINVITNELANRALLNDSSEPEPKSTHE